MPLPASPEINRMDRLSLAGNPFFFLINFVGDQIRIYEPPELKNIFIDFPAFQNIPEKIAIDKDCRLHPKLESFETYLSGFEIVQKHIKLGNSYLANYTRSTPVTCEAGLSQIFFNAKAKYKLCLPDEFLFFSPETFVTIESDQISTFPMKGTIDACIPEAETTLKNSAKEKAEHYTVVDLLRNDLSMVANEVRVQEFQKITEITTNNRHLLAMSSKISGKLRPEFRGKIGSIMQQLLPAGSILGAPKQKTLEIILEAEKYSRGFYTGVCGWFDGKNLDSCVMIRFLEKTAAGMVYKSGGGITHLSHARAEYDEMKNKIYVPVS